MGLRTVRFASTKAAGGGDGSRGTPWTPTESFANAANNDYVVIDNGGDNTAYTVPSAMEVAGTGSLANNTWIVFKGCHTFPSEAAVTAFEDDVGYDLVTDMDYGQAYYGGALDAYKEAHNLTMNNSDAEWVRFDGDAGVFDLLTLTNKDNIRFHNCYLHNVGHSDKLIVFDTSPFNTNFVNCKFDDARTALYGVSYSAFVNDCWFGTDWAAPSMMIQASYYPTIINSVVEAEATENGIYGGYGLRVSNSLFVGGYRGIIQNKQGGFVKNCTFYNQTGVCIQLITAGVIVEYNNLFMPAEAVDYAVFRSTTQGSIQYSDYSWAYNLELTPGYAPWYDSTNAVSFRGAHSTRWVDPDLTDPANGNFQPRNPSIIYGGKPDMEGVPTRIGCNLESSRPTAKLGI